MNRLTDIADRIVAEGAALVEAAASSDGRTAAGRTVDRWIGWVPGVDEGLNVIDGDPAERRRKRMRAAAQSVAVRLSVVLGEVVSADLKARGLESLLSLLADGAGLVPATVSVFEAETHDVTQLRGVLGGRAQTAAQTYVDEAAPRGSVSVPQRLYSAPHWATVTRAWPDFAEVGGRFVAVLAAYDAGGLPYAAKGVQALRRSYPEQMGQLEQSGGIFGDVGTVDQRSSGRPAVSTKPAKRVVNPKVKPTTKSKGGGGAALLGVGLLTLTGAGVAAAARSLRKRRKKRGRR